MAGDLDHDPRVRLVTLGDEPLDPAAVLAAVGHRAAGGNVLFVGTVRELTGDVATTRLEYEAHAPLARAELARLCGEAADRFGLVAVAVSHRLGIVEPGDASVPFGGCEVHGGRRRGGPRGAEQQRRDCDDDGGQRHRSRAAHCRASRACLVRATCLIHFALSSTHWFEQG